MPLDSDLTDGFVFRSPKRIVAVGVILFVLISVAAAIDFVSGGQFSGPSLVPLISPPEWLLAFALFAEILEYL